MAGRWDFVGPQGAELKEYYRKKIAIAGLIEIVKEIGIQNMMIICKEALLSEIPIRKLAVMDAEQALKEAEEALKDIE